MIEPVPITKEMFDRKQRYVDAITEQCNSMIKAAVAKGKSSCWFPCDKHSAEDAPFYNDVKKRFELAGYSIVEREIVSAGSLEIGEYIEW